MHCVVMQIGCNLMGVFKLGCSLPWVWILDDLSADFVQLLVVVKVIEFNDLVVQLHGDFVLASSVWSQLITIEQVEAFLEGGTAEWSEEIDSVLGWEAEAVSN